MTTPKRPHDEGRSVDHRRLMTSLGRGDARALDCIVEEYGAGLFRLLLGRVKDHALAEDLFQEVWQEVLKGHHKLRDPEKLVSWLHGIARNLAANALRKRGRRREVPLAGQHIDDDDVDSEHRKEMVDHSAPDPRERIRSTNLQERMIQLLGTLDDRSQEIFIMHYYDGLTAVEIARALNVPSGTVYSLLHRGLRKMRQSLQDAGLTLEELT